MMELEYLCSRRDDHLMQMEHLASSDEMIVV